MARRLPRPLALVATALLAAAAPARSDADWGADLEEAGPALLEEVRPRLAAIVRAPPSERPALVAAFVRADAEHAVEAVKRFRNPELVPLFHALLDHPEPQVVHRALLGLERLDDGTALPKAFALLAHEGAAVREKAGIACLRLWTAPGAEPVPDAGPTIDRLLATEPDAYVRAVLRALGRRAAGTLTVERVSDEVRVIGSDGLALTPFVHRMGTLRRVAPGYEPKYVARTAEGTPAIPPIAVRWCEPLRASGEAGFPPGRRLQGFGQPRTAGTRLHTGVDVGPFADGAGLYACAAGVVRLVYTGSDMGTLIVVEHRPSDHETATLLYMHAADVVFVRAGDLVTAGQLLGSMGLGYSVENGGHFAHLHFGAYPGPFCPGHNYGYKPASEGLEDWYDPAVVLPRWTKRTRPPVDDPGPVPPDLLAVAASMRDERYADALRELDARLARTDSPPAARAEARRLRALLLGAGAAAVSRARDLRARGFPALARALLLRDGALLRDLPGGDEAGREAAAWDVDPAPARALGEAGATGR